MLDPKVRLQPVVALQLHTCQRPLAPLQPLRAASNHALAQIPHASYRRRDSTSAYVAPRYQQVGTPTEQQAEGRLGPHQSSTQHALATMRDNWQFQTAALLQCKSQPRDHFNIDDGWLCSNAVCESPCACRSNYGTSVARYKTPIQELLGVEPFVPLSRDSNDTPNPGGPADPSAAGVAAAGGCDTCCGSCSGGCCGSCCSIG